MINFTFIIPHYNLESSLLRRCLDSIPHRDDVQIIVVDDHSPELYDVKGNIIEEKKIGFPGYGEACTEVLFLPKNGGPGIARNEALSHAKGEWILFADADDFYTDRLNQLLNLSSKSQCDVIWFGETADVYGLSKVDSREIVRCDKEEKLKFLSISSPCNKIVRKQFYLDNNISFTSSMYGEDQIMSAQLVCESKFPGFYPEHIYVYDRREGSLSKTDNLIRLKQGFAFELKYNIYLRGKGILSVQHRNPFLGGLLYRIYLQSPWRYRWCCIREFLTLGWPIAWADYKTSCIQRNIRPNFYYQLTDPIRVWLGSKIHKCK